MGLTTWKNAPRGKILNNDVAVAKNYLIEREIKELERIVSMYLDYAENQAARQIAMKMADWVAKLDAFPQFNEYEVLANAGNTAGDACYPERQLRPGTALTKPDETSKEGGRWDNPATQLATWRDHSQSRSLSSGPAATLDLGPHAPHNSSARRLRRGVHPHVLDGCDAIPESLRVGTARGRT